jgi:hypothetical protein
MSETLESLERMRKTLYPMEAIIAARRPRTKKDMFASSRGIGPKPC